jgi:hypothetical protein
MGFLLDVDLLLEPLEFESSSIERDPRVDDGEEGKDDRKREDDERSNNRTPPGVCPCSDVTHL